jgi:hypothetical protein
MGFRSEGRSTLLVVVVAAGALLGSLPSSASAAGPEDLDAFARALTTGKVSVDLRYRAESVDQKGATEGALASTVRARLGYQTAPFANFYAYADIEAIANVGDDRYNSTANGRTDLPLVPDPQDTEVNQAYVSWSGIPNTSLQLGRQRMILDNSRFIGNGGWRQNEQTFDALTLHTSPLPNLTLFAAHVTNVNLSYGEHNPNQNLANLDVSSELFNLAYKTPIGTATAYAYLVNMQHLPQSSHRDLGLRFNGQASLPGGFKALYTAEYAAQGKYADSDPRINASYYFGEFGVGIGKCTLKVGRELLSSFAGDYSFQTPLATLHNFNGWADKFLTTPSDGLEDVFAGAQASIASFGLTGVYHQFKANNGGAEYGTEIDVALERTFHETYTASVMYAAYDAKTYDTGTNKLWVTLGLKL